MKYILALVLIVVAIYLIIRFWTFLLILAVLSLAGSAIIKYFRDKQTKSPEDTQVQKEKLIELLLCLFLGWAGAHKFYRMKKGWGIAYLLTLGLCCVGWWGDLVQLCYLYFNKAGVTAISGRGKISVYAVVLLCALVMGSCGADQQNDKADTDPTIPTQAVIETMNEETTIPETTETSTEPTVSTETTTEPSEATEIIETTEATAEATVEATTEPTETEPVGTTYILNTNSKKFHYEWCSSAAQTKESNKRTFVGTREELIERGYEPCGRCKP